VPNDPLEGIALRIVARTGSAKAAPEAPRVAARRGPQFSKFREEVQADTPHSGAGPAPAKRDAKAKPRKATPAAPRRAKPAPPRKRTATPRRQASP
jgi:hypothetical protein